MYRMLVNGLWANLRPTPRITVVRTKIPQSLPQHNSAETESQQYGAVFPISPDDLTAPIPYSRVESLHVIDQEGD